MTSQADIWNRDALSPTAVTPSRTTVGTRTAARSNRLWALIWQVLLVALAALVYFGVRHLTEGSVATADDNAHAIIDLERALGIHHEAALQNLVLDDTFLQKLANGVYIFGHWPVIISVLLWLAIRRPERYPLYRNTLLLSGLIGMVIFATFPVTPPRLLDIGLIDTVSEQTSAYRVLQPPSLVNQYAAMPSFHVGWDLLMGLALVLEGRRLWMRALGVLLPLAMAFSVVTTANHYLLDPVAGIAIVLAAYAFCGWRLRRTASRRSAEPLGQASRGQRDDLPGRGEGRGVGEVRPREVVGREVAPQGHRDDVDALRGPPAAQHLPAE